MRARGMQGRGGRIKEGVRFRRRPYVRLAEKNGAKGEERRGTYGANGAKPG